MFYSSGVLAPKSPAPGYTQAWRIFHRPRCCKTNLRSTFIKSLRTQPPCSPVPLIFTFPKTVGIGRINSADTIETQLMPTSRMNSSTTDNAKICHQKVYWPRVLSTLLVMDFVVFSLETDLLTNPVRPNRKRIHCIKCSFSCRKKRIQPSRNAQIRNSRTSSVLYKEK